MTFKKALKVFKSLNDLVPEYSNFFITRSDTTPYTFRDSVNKLTIPLHCHAQIIVEIVSATVVLFFGIVFLNPIQIGGGGAFSGPPSLKSWITSKQFKLGPPNLADFSWNLSVNILMSPWRVRQHWCYHGNRVLTAMFFEINIFSKKIGVISIFIDWIIT